MDIVAVNDKECRALTTAASSSSSGKVISREEVEWLREQRETHRYKTIWTKDPHGGPYKKATGGKGIDPFKENLDGSLKQVELGYEEAEVGPTSNFVGNHMTQGAIDMVQALLNMKTTHSSNVDDGTKPRLLKQGEEPLSENTPLHQLGDGLIRPKDQQEEEGDMYKNLDIVEWDQDNETVVIIFQRPYSEDVSVSMSLSTVLTNTSITVRYLITAKDGTMMREYRKEIASLHAQIDPSKSGCHLGGGTVDEMKASPNLAGQCIPVSHSHPSTMICLVLRKLEPGRVWNALEKGHDTKESSLTLSHGDENALKDLKSFIRSNRKK